MEYRSTEWREAPNPISILLACGWLTSDQADHARSHIDTTSSSHALTRVSDPAGRKVVVKCVPLSAAARERSLRSEMFVYRLARWMPAVAAVVPRPVFIDERRHVLVVESLAHGRVWPDPNMHAPLSEPRVARELGALLVEFHRATEHMQMWPSPAPGILGLPDSLAYASAGRHSHTQALMSSIVHDAQLSAALRTGAQHYAARCVIHGDLRVENWARDEGSELRALKIFDWELAGSGDPLWDLSSLLAAALFEHLLHDAAHTGLTLDGIAVQAQALLHGYFERWQVLAREPSTLPKLAQYWLARLLHIACEHTDHGADPEIGTVRALLETARSMAAHHAHVMEMISAWLPRL